MNRRNSVIISLGGIPIRIQSDNKLLVDLAQYGFRGFLLPTGRPVITVSVLIDDTRDMNAYSYGKPHHTSVVSDSGKFFAKGSTYSGMFDILSLEGEVRQSVAIAPLYLFLRFILSVYLPFKGGFVLHSNSILKGGKCFLFSGKPQSGKSTVARLSSNYEILSDDFSIVRKMGGFFRAFGSPFWGHVEARGENIKNALGCASIAGIYFLSKDTNVYAEKLGRKESVFKIIENMAILSKDRDANARLLSLADEFACAVNCGILHFKLDNSFWRCIDNA